jgi:hypothetical protein
VVVFKPLVPNQVGVNFKSPALERGAMILNERVMAFEGRLPTLSATFRCTLHFCLPHLGYVFLEGSSWLVGIEVDVEGNESGNRCQYNFSAAF